MKAKASGAAPAPCLRLNNVVDALDDLDSHLAALEAVEQLMTPQKLGNTEDLAHVNREGLAFMYCVLNTAVREKFALAKALADAAYELNLAPSRA